MTRAGAIDIGTNSMRLLIAERIGEEVIELGRWQRVTGLGRGVDGSGRLSEASVDRTLVALAEFGGRLGELRVDRRRAVATSASREAANRESFLDRAGVALGTRPQVISGEEEARLAYAGATAGTFWEAAPLVVDIGGGSTEFVTAQGGISLRVGSVRLTERRLPGRPAAAEELAAAREEVEKAFSTVRPWPGPVLGVAGTWTSLAGIRLGHENVHLTELSRAEVSGLVARLAGLGVDATAALPGFDPQRAPVILAGAVVAEGAIRALGAELVMVSTHDLLDGVVADLLE
jgi:exopolyphosphatase/guanosine-5'-triphosphate,3'-diphosphate pyrophosphatase